VKKTITVTDAPRKFADSPVARLVPDNKKICTGSDLAAAVASAKLSQEDARAWRRDLHHARSHLNPLNDK
jgi:hypothetical protein